MRRAALVLLSTLLLTSCSSDKKAEQSPPTEVPSPTPSCPLDGPSIPAACVVDPVATPTVFPADASRIAPVTLMEIKGRLGGADNRTEATKRVATFTVTVPAGSRLGSAVLCLGNGSVKVDTVPESQAFQEITCNADPEVASELIAEDPDVLTETTTFTATVTADGPSRWDVVLFSTTAKPGFSQG